MGAHDFKPYNMPFFCSKTGEFQCFEVCCRETSSCASKLLYGYVKQSNLKVVPSFIRIERGSDGSP